MTASGAGSSPRCPNSKRPHPRLPRPSQCPPQALRLDKIGRGNPCQSQPRASHPGNRRERESSDKLSTLESRASRSEMRPISLSDREKSRKNPDPVRVRRRKRFLDQILRVRANPLAASSGRELSRPKCGKKPSNREVGRERGADHHLTAAPVPVPRR